MKIVEFIGVCAHASTLLGWNSKWSDTIQTICIHFEMNWQIFAIRGSKNTKINVDKN